eukprot:scaffold108363_cov21-Tisochrysis_lutea.AAC.2
MEYNVLLQFYYMMADSHPRKHCSLSCKTLVQKVAFADIDDTSSHTSDVQSSPNLFSYFNTSFTKSQNDLVGYCPLAVALSCFGAPYCHMAVPGF